MSDDLRTRVARAIYNACDEYTRKLLVRPDCPGASELEGDGMPVCFMLADAVIRKLNIPDRTHLDDAGRLWEWCGGVPGTWAWRITRLPDHNSVIRDVGREINTTEELDALPFLTVIREVRQPRHGVDYGGIYERRTSGWQCIAGTWVEPERNGAPSLPVIVLWRGKDTNG